MMDAFSYVCMYILLFHGLPDFHLELILYGNSDDTSALDQGTHMFKMALNLKKNIKIRHTV